MSCFNAIYICGSVRAEISRHETSGGLAEEHVVFHATDAGVRFEAQLDDIHAAYRALPEGERAMRSVFLRYFLSDAANQQDIVRANCPAGQPAAVSVVQQPPLDGTKIALWVYRMSDVQVEPAEGGVVASHHGYRHIWTAGSHSPDGDSATQTAALFERYAGDLARHGCTVAEHCIRTWLFVHGVDVNYRGMVEARKIFFERIGLTPQTHYIASTGIEGRLADPAVQVVMDACAVGGLQPAQQQFLHAPSHLSPTHTYGVTFERGVSVRYGDREHILLSGTASIDNRGEIVAPGDAMGQTLRMIENVRALLDEAGASADDLVQMIVYLRDASDYHTLRPVFDEHFGTVPRAMVLAPVCRPGWLVEMECIAVKQACDPRFNRL